MHTNPELHYIDHVQNTSISKHCFAFARAPRFPTQNSVTLKLYSSTDFNYNPKQLNISRSCSFGFGNRASLSAIGSSPSPNKYDVSKFPSNQRTTSLGFSRQQANFGTITVQIKQKSKIPAPNAYQSFNFLKNRKFTLRKKLKTQFDVSKRQILPGPGQYQPIGINKQGKCSISTIKNIRYVFLDSHKPDINPRLDKIGPGAYNVLAATAFNSQNIQKMKSTTCKPFGTQKRRGPQEVHRLFVPGPGIYDSFSCFGNQILPFQNKSTPQN